jgi:hypothetical protein
LNKFKKAVKDLAPVRKFIIAYMIVAALLYLFKALTAMDHIVDADYPLDAMNIVIFGMILISYSYYFDNTFKGIVTMTVAMVINNLTYMAWGYSFSESLQLCGSETLPAMLGIVIMLLGSIISDRKTPAGQEKKKFVDLYDKPKRVKVLYKAMVYCIMFSIFVTVYKSEDLSSVTNAWLKTLMVLQVVLPSMIILGYITLTDIAFPLMVLYNIVYVAITITIFNYVDFTLVTLLNAVALTLTIAYVASARSKLSKLEKDSQEDKGASDSDKVEY